jgi:hypothetical protein
MELKDNPLLKPEDFLGGYRDSIEELKNRPELISFEKLCYEVFATEQGKKLMEIIDQRYLIPSIVSREAPNYQVLLLWSDGFKDAFRMIKQNIISHEQRIQAGTDNDRRNN